MKRANSKKDSAQKTEIKSQSQQKISLFFQAGPAQPQSQLFSTISQKSKSELSLKRSSGSASSVSAPGSKKSVPSSRTAIDKSSAGADNSVAATKPLALERKGNKVLTPSSSNTMVSAMKHNQAMKDNQAHSHKSPPQKAKPHMTTLKAFSATQYASSVLKTPPKALSASVENSNIIGSPDVMIIPDTPEEKLCSKPGKPGAKPASRSFLCPSNMLTTMPGKRAISPKKARKLTKKTLGIVTVELGKKQSNIGKNNNLESNGQGCTGESGTHGLDHSDSSIINTFGRSNKNTEELLEVKVSFDQDADYTDFSFETEQIGSDGFQNLGSGTVLSEKPSEDETIALKSITVNQQMSQSSTPTKSTADGKTKRMAKSGLSPNPKRALSDEFEKAAGCIQFKAAASLPLAIEKFASNSKDAEDSVMPELTVVQKAAKAKRQLASFSGFRDLKEMAKTVNNYQLGGSAKGRETADKSSLEDDVLTDILGQMGDTHIKQSNSKCGGKVTINSSQPLLTQKLHHREESMVLVPTTSSTKFTKICAEGIDFTKVSKEKMDTEPTLTSDGGDDVLDEILGELSEQLGSHCGTSTQKSRKKNSLCIKQNFKNEPLGASLQSSSKEQAENSQVKIVCSTSAVDGDHDDKLNAKSSATEIDLLDFSSTFDKELAGSFGQLSPFKKSAPSHRHRSANQAERSSRQSPAGIRFTDRWNRFVVKSITRDRHSHELVLDLSRDGDERKLKKAFLRGCWSDTHVEAGDIVHLLFEKEHSTDNEDFLVVDDTKGQVVVNPDLLLSGTTVVSGVFCLRKSVLNEKFKGVDSKNAHMLYGSIIHSLFQKVLKERLVKTEAIHAAAKAIVKSNKFLHDMYGQSVSEAKVMEEIKVYIPPLQAWMEKHVPSRPSHRAGQTGDISVVQIHDIEETIWSPRIGVKGKIDMTVEVEMWKTGGQLTKKVVPLELKTGKASYSAEHKGQVTLYSLMMCDRRESPGEGLLLYLKHNDMNTVPVKPESVTGLLQLRNEMAYYMSRQVQKATTESDQVKYHLGRLPSPVNNLRACSKCPQLLNCAMYQKSVEGLQLDGDHAMRGLVPDALSHLSDSHLRYFTHWLLCLDLEAVCQRNESLRNIWCMTSAEREEKGDCLQQLVMVDSTLGVPETQGFTEGQGCCVQFQRRPGFPAGPLDEAGLSKNDAIVISSEDGCFIALSTGFIKDTTSTSVDVVVDRDSFHENAAFQSLVFRLDRCDTFNTSSYLLTNLSRLLDSSVHSRKLRSLIIDGAKPEFDLKMAKSAIEKVKKIFKPLNKPQKTAILKVLMCKDFVLIKGYPGTGKTSTIVALVKILRELGQSVLLTSYTHSAVDNILLKLKQDGVPFLRLGRTNRIHPQIQDHAAETLTLDITSVEELKDFYNSYAIVATSCLGTNSPMLSQREKFDICIVDEGSQVLQPACLGPLFHAQRFVLVGDPLQLPPVVQSREASELGMGESLFSRLDGAGATYDLSLQYRMNNPIMQLSNELVYKGALKCGAENVGLACIQPADFPVVAGSAWLQRSLDPSLTNAVVFLDTKQMKATEICDSSGVTNPAEVSLITCLSTTFVQAGILARDIGVIAPYKAQVKALQHRLKEYCSLREVEVNTVDQYQGRDKSVIFISFVRSSASSSGESVSKGGLLQDVRRLNVAVTRAKHKLVMVGDSATLSQFQPVSMLITNLLSRQQIYTLPAEVQLENLLEN